MSTAKINDIYLLKYIKDKILICIFIPMKYAYTVE